MNIFWHEDFVDIFWGSKLDYIKLSFLFILGSFLKVKLQNVFFFFFFFGGGGGGSLKFQIFLGCLEFLIFFGVNGRCQA